MRTLVRDFDGVDESIGWSGEGSEEPESGSLLTLGHCQSERPVFRKLRQGQSPWGSSSVKFPQRHF